MKLKCKFSFQFRIFSFNSIKSKVSYSLLSSLIIDTPEKLSLLRDGAYSDFKNVVYITATADPNVLLLPMEFSCAPFLQVHFDDGHNRVYVHPVHKYVAGKFTVGANLTLGLPSDYVRYALTFGPKVSVTEDDLANIMRWKDATDLEFSDHGDLPARLAQRIQYGQWLRRLEKITLDARRHSYETLQAAGFIKRLDSLTYIRFKYGDLNLKEAEQFTEKQRATAWWKCEEQGDSFKCFHQMNWLRH